jgi:hypothetical protein
MPRRHWIAVGCLLVALASLTACGGSEEAAGPSGQLRVEQPGQFTGYIEGAVSFIELRDANGNVVEKESRQPFNREPVLMGESGRSIPVGRYELVAYARGCVGNCGALDPPSRECIASLKIEKDTLTVATVRHDGRGPCEIDLERKS